MTSETPTHCHPRLEWWFKRVRSRNASRYTCNKAWVNTLLLLCALTTLATLGTLYTGMRTSIFPTSTSTPRTFAPLVSDAPEIAPKSAGPYDKLAIAIKTGRKVVAQRLPIQLMTFLQHVPNILLIGEHPVQLGPDLSVHDVVSGVNPRMDLSEPDDDDDDEFGGCRLLLVATSA
jgi:hypothetical protein